MFGLMPAVLLLNALVRFSLPIPFHIGFVEVHCQDISFLFMLETFPSIGRVRVKHRGILLTLKGTLIRSGAAKMIEGEKWYECRRCKHRFIFMCFLNALTLGFKH